MAVYDDLIDKVKLARFHDNLKTNGLPLHDWAASTSYKVGYVVVSGGEIYRCTTAHTSSSTFDPTKFEVISSNNYSGIILDDWETSHAYVVDDIVLYNNAFYKCITAHTSDASDFTNDAANWVRITGDQITIAENQDIDDMFT